MLIRFFLILAALLIAVSGALYLFTHNARYLNFAWSVVRFLFISGAILLLLLVLERYALVGWGVLHF